MGFAIGSDLYHTLHLWDEGDRVEWLLNECKWLVFDRPGFPLPEDLKPNYELVNAVKNCTIVSQELSSSEIRMRIKTDLNLVDGLIPPSVLAHIVRYKLYQD